MEGVSFEYDSELPHYSKPPYANIGESLEVFKMALEEVNRNLSLGKILPLRVIPWIENRTTAVMKVAPLEPAGVKWRTCVDLTASGVNLAVESWGFGLPTISSIVEKMGLGYVIVKMDLKDMFLSWNVHPERWVLLGFRHPLTSQAYVYPVLPFGFTISPPIACRNTQLLADLIEKEMRARWEGREGSPALSSVARLARVPKTSPAPPPASSVYVDDYAN
eukprot:305982-Rhodomonas_salina.1